MLVTRTLRLPKNALCKLQSGRRLIASQLPCAGGNKPVAGRGALIVFEGIDRCGKSTQCRMLLDALKEGGVPVEHWCFPDRTTKIGHFINDYLKSRVTVDDAAIQLMFAANRFEKRAEMLGLLAGGTTLVLDRYSYSGVAYSAAKGLDHLSPQYCRSVEVGLPAADLVVHMALSPEEAAYRDGFGGERYEKLDFQRKVAAQYAALADERWLTLDATAPAEQLHGQVMAAVLPLLQRVRAGQEPLGRLWDYQPIPLPARETAPAPPPQPAVQES